MLETLTDYYTQKDYNYAFLLMRKEAQRRRIIAEAKIITAAKKDALEAFKKLAEDLASETERTIIKLKEQLDHSIKGDCRYSLEKALERKEEELQAVLD